MSRSSVVLTLALSLAAIAGCAHKAERKPDVAPTSSASAAAATPAATANAPANTCNTDLDCGDKQLCIRQRCVEITPDLEECRALRVHFAFNETALDTNDTAMLQRSARCLKADHALHVTIEGNADERGTEEFNMALGDKRASGVARYLESLGVSADQMKTVSYGKENPLCVEHDEACWARNRRASIQPVETAPAPKK